MTSKILLFLSLVLLAIFVITVCGIFINMNCVNDIDNPYEPHNVSKVVGALNSIVILLFICVILCLVSEIIAITWVLLHVLS